MIDRERERERSGELNGESLIEQLRGLLDTVLFWSVWLGRLQAVFWSLVLVQVSVSGSGLVQYTGFLLVAAEKLFLALCEERVLVRAKVRLIKLSTQKKGETESEVL